MFSLIKCALWVTLVSVVSTGASSYEVWFVEPDAITIDGSLDDWIDSSSEEQSIIFSSPRFALPNGEDDIEAVFRAAADREHLFFAISVSDDEIMFGLEAFSKTWRQDCVEVYLDGDLQNDTGEYDTNDRQIRVSSLDGNSAQLEGACRVGEHIAKLPLLWDALGVQAALRQHADGYDVELRIPAAVIDHRGLSNSSRIGVNVRVIDVDRDRALKVLSWNPDPNSTSWMDTRSLSEVRLVGSEAVPKAASSRLEGGDIVISPAGDRSVAEAALHVAQGEWERAVRALDKILRDSKVPAVRAFAAYTLANYALERDMTREAAKYLEEFMDEDPARFGLRDWVDGTASVQLARSFWNVGRKNEALEVLLSAASRIDAQSIGAYYSIGSTMRGLRRFHPPKKKVDEFVNEFMSEFPARCNQAIAEGGKRAYVGRILLGWHLENLGKYEEAIEHYRASMEYDDEDPDPHIYVGRCLFALGRNGEAITSLNTGLSLKALVREHFDLAVPLLVRAHVSNGMPTRGAEILSEFSSKMSPEVHAGTISALRTESD